MNSAVLEPWLAVHFALLGIIVARRVVLFFIGGTA
jgi:hypothetical protein